MGIWIWDKGISSLIHTYVRMVVPSAKIGLAAGGSTFKEKVMSSV